MDFFSEGFDDPEAAYENRNRIHFFVRKMNEKVIRSRLLRIYLGLCGSFIVLILLRGIIPRDDDIDVQGVQFAGFRPAFTILQQFTPYRTILQSKDLVARFNKGTTIQPIQHPHTHDSPSMEAIRFKKELNVLRGEMLKTIQVEEFTCLPAIALGVPYNVYLDRHGTIMLNVHFEKVVNSHENTTVAIIGVFGDAFAELLYESIAVSYFDPNNAKHMVNQTIYNIDAFCLQSYLNNFAFEGKNKNRNKLQIEL